jgi:transposase InsO family protein
LKIGETLETMITSIRRERRLGVKRIRNELQRLSTAQLSVATIHKVLVRHGLNNLPTRKRVRHTPKRYERPVPGDRVQMDTCKIRPGVYQFTVIDDCSRYLVAGLSRRRSAAATLTILDQVLEEMPFSVQRIQTDGGTEFFAEDVQRRLMNETIRFRPIPPQSPPERSSEHSGRVWKSFGQRRIRRQPTSVTSPRCGFITTTGTAHTSPYTETLRSTEVCQQADKTPLGQPSVMLMTQRKSGSEFETIPLI